MTNIAANMLFSPALSETFEHIMQALGWSLLHSLWQGCLIASLCALGLALLRNATAQKRYALSCASLLATLLWPVAVLIQELAQPHSMSLLTALERVNTASLQLTQIDLVFQESSGFIESLQRCFPYFVSLWCIGVCLMLLRLGSGIIWVNRIRQQHAAVPRHWQQRTQELATHFKIHRKVRLQVVAESAALSSQIHSPITVACLRPVILMPAALLTGMPPELIDALLAHELAHIKRWDYLFNLIQTLIVSLMFYHPAVWWLSKRITIERELVADDLAVSALEQPRNLAQALHKLDQWQLQAMTKESNYPLAMAASGGDLLSRIKRLIRPATEPWRWNMASPIIGVLFACCITMLYQNTMESEVQNQSENSSVQSGKTTPAANENPAQKINAIVQMHSEHALVIDDSTGEVLYEKQADQIVPIASLSKLLTAMLILDAQSDAKLDMQEKIIIDQADVPTGQTSASRLPVGISLTREEVLHLSLIASDNRAAKALARTYPGSNKAFLYAMQQKIKALGLSQTTIVEPSGISSKNTSSAIDIAKIASAAARYPELRSITSTEQESVTAAWKGKDKTLDYQNTNPFVGRKDWPVLLSKTGYTRDAGRCVLMRFQLAERSITLVLLNASDSDSRSSDVVALRELIEKQSEKPRTSQLSQPQVLQRFMKIAGPDILTQSIQA